MHCAELLLMTFCILRILKESELMAACCLLALSSLVFSETLQAHVFSHLVCWSWELVSPSHHWLSRIFSLPFFTLFSSLSQACVISFATVCDLAPKLSNSKLSSSWKQIFSKITPWYKITPRYSISSLSSYFAFIHQLVRAACEIGRMLFLWTLWRAPDLTR